MFSKNSFEEFYLVTKDFVNRDIASSTFRGLPLPVFSSRGIPPDTKSLLVSGVLEEPKFLEHLILR